jgi:hypothetical protein
VARARQRHLSRAERARLGASLATRAAGDRRAVVVERVNRLTPGQRKFLFAFLDSGNVRRSVIAAGYNVKSLRSADDIGRELLSSPNVQYCYQAILEAKGLGTAKLNQLLAVYVSRYSSPNRMDRALGLRGIAMVYKHAVPRPLAEGAKPFPECLFDEMTTDELECYAITRVWPARFASRLRAAGWTLSAFAAAPEAAEAPGRPVADQGDNARPGLADDDRVSASPPAPRPTAPALPPDEDTTPPPPVAASRAEPARAPDPSAQGAEPHAWQRPENRVFAPRRPAPEPPAPQLLSGPAALDTTDASTEAKRARALHALATRDRRW